MTFLFLLVYSFITLSLITLIYFKLNNQKQVILQYFPCYLRLAESWVQTSTSHSCFSVGLASGHRAGLLSHVTLPHLVTRCKTPTTIPSSSRTHTAVNSFFCHSHLPSNSFIHSCFYTSFRTTTKADVGVTVYQNLNLMETSPSLILFLSPAQHFHFSFFFPCAGGEKKTKQWDIPPLLPDLQRALWPPAFLWCSLLPSLAPQQRVTSDRAVRHM